VRRGFFRVRRFRGRHSKSLGGGIPSSRKWDANGYTRGRRQFSEGRSIFACVRLSGRAATSVAASERRFSNRKDTPTEKSTLRALIKFQILTVRRRLWARLYPARRASDHPGIACNNPLPVPASILPCASLRESLNREPSNPKLDLFAMSLVIQGF
jgi:hypothetical protein